MNENLQKAIDFLIEKYHELRALPDISPYEQGYMNACEVIMKAVLKDD